jgi:putative nucleotidyltransferase with HDIG domain
MPRPANTLAARQVEQIIRRFSSLSTLPAVVARFLWQAGASPVAVDIIAELIESDPALSATIFALAHQHGIAFDGTAAAIAELSRRLSPAVIRDAVLSTKVFRAIEPNSSKDSPALLWRKQLALHSLAVGCCSKQLARLCLPEADWAPAFSAGLLHDIGKLAIEDAMPKGFDRIITTARRQNASSCDIEQQHLGLDHATIGKRLAQKLGVPEDAATAIWLHHSDVELVEENMPAARIAPVIRLADAIVRTSGIGDSGSYDSCEGLVTSMAEYLKLSAEQIQQVRSALAPEVGRRVQLLGLEDGESATAYCDAVQSTALQLSGDVTRLATENRRLATGATIFDFTDDFFAAINSTSNPIDIAADFARRWQKFFQTGTTCICLPDSSQPGIFTVVTPSADGKSESLVVNCPENQPLIPSQIQNTFAVIAAQGESSWLLERLRMDADAARVRIAPLMAGDKAVALLVFEQRYMPASTDYLKTFAELSTIAGGVLAMALAQQRHQEMAERFVLLSNRLRQAQKSLADANALIGLAEMAAGAAHELNTPLAVISGRAQLLLDTEDDPQRQQMLQQMIDRSHDVSQIVQDLLAFAEPSKPRPVSTDVKSLLSDAIGQTAKRLGTKTIEAQVRGDEDLPVVMVDPSQIVPALAHVLTNAQEAYPSGAGPVNISCSFDEAADCVLLEIADSAGGMSPEVLAKATQPFFSAKPAGRQRGMGLAHARRFINLNGGSLSIASQQGLGTTVSISLPVANVL